MDNIGQENNKFLQSSLQCYEQAAKKCDTVKNSGKSCLMTTMMSAQCSKSDVNRAINTANKAFRVRKSMDETIGQLKETLSKNERFLDSREENELGTSSAPIYKFDPTRLDTWGIKATLVSFFPNRVSKSLKRMFGPNGARGSSQGGYTPRTVRGQESFGAQGGGGDFVSREASSNDSALIEQAQMEERRHQSAGGDGMAAGAVGHYGSGGGDEPQITYTLDDHNRVKEQRVDRTKLANLDRKYGKKNPYRKNIGKTPPPQKAAGRIKKKRDPVITSASGPSNFEKVNARYRTYHKKLLIRSR